MSWQERISEMAEIESLLYEIEYKPLVKAFADNIDKEMKELGQKEITT